VIYHYQNDRFFRGFVKIWEENIIDDYQVCFSAKYGRRYCLSNIRVIRYLNFHEWMTLWKERGYIVEESIIRDNFCYYFVIFAKNYAYLTILTKYLPLVILFFTIDNNMLKYQIFQTLLTGIIQTILMLEWILNCKVDKLSLKHDDFEPRFSTQPHN
jgi:hypothetical protein